VQTVVELPAPPPGGGDTELPEPGPVFAGLEVLPQPVRKRAVAKDTNENPWINLVIVPRRQTP
jgi:hypothetical protein